MDTGDPPFTAQNRPWLTSECIDAMNEEYVACMLNVPPESREALKEWAAVKVEMRTCHDRPDVRARCEGYGERFVSETLQRIKAEGPPLRA